MQNLPGPSLVSLQPLTQQWIDSTSHNRHSRNGAHRYLLRAPSLAPYPPPPCRPASDRLHSLGTILGSVTHPRPTQSFSSPPLPSTSARRADAEQQVPQPGFPSGLHATSRGSELPLPAFLIFPSTLSKQLICFTFTACVTSAYCRWVKSDLAIRVSPHRLAVITGGTPRVCLPQLPS